MNKQITRMNAMHSFCMSYRILYIGPLPFTNKLTKIELENVCKRNKWYENRLFGGLFEFHKT